MEFKLQFKIPAFQTPLKPGDSIFFSGSCFAENISAYFERYKFSSFTNPHGILYNPISIAHSLQEVIENKHYEENELQHSNGLYFSFSHHGRFSGLDANTVLRHINSTIITAHEHLQKTDFLFITFGSAFAYEHIDSKQLVGNCHKVPQKEFKKLLLTKNTILKEWNLLLETLSVFNPDLNVVFTVSPVRYIRDGLMENNLSKAILLQCVHELVAEHNNCSYFPAYEIVIDELRDYRFFEADMVHPNELATAYVWERLVESAFQAEGKTYISKLDEILKGSKHRSFHPDSEEHLRFKRSLLQKCEAFEEQFPFTSLREIKILLS